jgi:hypothetical protein
MPEAAGGDGNRGHARWQQSLPNQSVLKRVLGTGFKSD